MKWLSLLLFCGIVFGQGAPSSSNYPTSGGSSFASGAAGTGYQDVTEIAAPSNPAAGVQRIYSDSTSHLLTCLRSSGASCFSAGAVTSVFTRTGAVVAAIGDYTAAQVTNAVDSTNANTFGAAGTLNLGSSTATVPFVLPNGTPTNPALTFQNGATFGLISEGATTWSMGTGSATGRSHTWLSNGLFKEISGGAFCWVASATNSTGACDSGVSRGGAAGIVAAGNGAGGDETGLLRSGNPCRLNADIALTVNTDITVCTWSLPAVARTWAFQCQIPWVISAGTGTNTLIIKVNPSQTPTLLTFMSAEIKTTNTNTATEATAQVSTSGATTLLTSPTITPSATVFMSSVSGALNASATAGTFAITYQAAGTTVTAAARAGGNCWFF